MRSRYLLTLAATLGGMYMAIPTARAQTACGEETCPPGHTCEVSSYDNCAYECDETADGRDECRPTTCDTEEYTYCQRAACETDADCGGEMVCNTFVAAACPGAPTCAPGENCVLSEPQGCTQEEYKQCTPRSELPCQAASDCGAGYDCVEAVSCWCSGGMASGGTDNGGMANDAPDEDPTTAGGATPPARPTDADAPQTDPGAAPAPGGEDCGCSPTGVNYCQLQEIVCSTDADCPAHFNCLVSSSSCWEDSEGNSGCTEGTSMCYPEAIPGGGMGPSEATGGPAPVPQEEQDANDEDSIEPEADDHHGTPDEAEEGSGSMGGLFAFFGCSVNSSVAHAGTASWAWLTAGIASILLRRRRP